MRTIILDEAVSQRMRLRICTFCLSTIYKGRREKMRVATSATILHVTLIVFCFSKEYELIPPFLLIMIANCWGTSDKQTFTLQWEACVRKDRNTFHCCLPSFWGLNWTCQWSQAFGFMSSQTKHCLGGHPEWEEIYKGGVW